MAPAVCQPYSVLLTYGCLHIERRIRPDNATFIAAPRGCALAASSAAGYVLVHRELCALRRCARRCPPRTSACAGRPGGALLHDAIDAEAGGQAALHNTLADLHHLCGETQQAMEQLKQAVVIFAEIGIEVGADSAGIWMLREW